MNLLFKEIFSGKVVNKRLTFNTGMGEFPRYVLEYLIDNYCEEETFEEDFEGVKRRLTVIDLTTWIDRQPISCKAANVNYEGSG